MPDNKHQGHDLLIEQTETNEYPVTGIQINDGIAVLSIDWAQPSTVDVNSNAIYCATCECSISVEELGAELWETN